MVRRYQWGFNGAVASADASHRAIPRVLVTEVWEGGTWSAGCGPGKAGMASKDKGGRSTKTPATKTAKEKRLDKQEKKTRKSFTGREN
jgi:hypothetical protein